MSRRKHLRVALLVLVVVSSGVVAGSWATREPRGDAPPGDGTTVITAQGRDVIGDTGRMVAFDEDGDVVAEHKRYSTYFDVDPVPGEANTVEYAAVDYVPRPRCPEQYQPKGNNCAHQFVLRTNLTTNETTVVWETYYPKLHKMHDFDRINDTHIVVADIYRDAVHFVNVSSGERTWTWRANETYEYGEEGGTGPTGFTHINDVEMVRDGWVMATLRNFDRTVFIDPGNGVVESWTIGCEDCHDVLYEHHNSDYMPGESGDSPTVIIADSENDRIVEYTRIGDEWRLTWTYTNPEMHWPRDADRLPNGNTLVTDSNANRVYEVAPNGTIVWSVVIGNPYDAERMGTGDESSNLPSRESRLVGSTGPLDWLLLQFRAAVPSKLLSGALFVMPYWAGVGELLAVVAGALAALGLAGSVGRERVAGPLRARIAEHRSGSESDADPGDGPAGGS